MSNLDIFSVPSTDYQLQGLQNSALPQIEQQHHPDEVLGAGLERLLNPKQTGNVRLEIKFRAALNANITILVWGEFESVIYIDHLGAVTYDNSV